jgi:hypothetical protein
MSVRPDVGLERLLDGLERELLAAPDEEFVAGARDLGMNPEMKGSAAFVGVKTYLRPYLNARRVVAEGSDATVALERAATTKRPADA